jgi:phage gpG-like protein
MSVEYDISQLRETLEGLNKFASGDSPFLARALHRAGSLLANQIRLELRQSGLRRRTGDLANSIDYRIKQQSGRPVAEVGSFGVKYAAIHEFGGAYSIPAHVRNQTTVWGRRLETPIQVNVRAHTRNYTARPFVRPAILRQADNVAAVIKEEMEKSVQ